MSEIKRKYQTIIFDLDGTLLDTLNDIKNAGNLALRKHNYPTHSLEKYRNTIGNGMKKLVTDLAPSSIDETMFKVLYQDFLSYYENEFTKTSYPYPKMNEVINTLKKQHYNLAVLSNKKDQYTNILINMHFPNTFQLIYGERDMIPRKPNPHGIYDIIKKLNVKPRNTILVGDSYVDYQTALNAEIFFIGVNWGFKKLDLKQMNSESLLINEPLELLNVLEKLEKE